MYSFMNDYSEGAHPRILEMLSKSTYEKNSGYGMDVHTKKAKEYIKRLIKKENADIHLIPAGTQTNLLVISSFLRPHECVIAADTGHVSVHEAGAIEATGHKVYTVPNTKGKLTPADIINVLECHKDEHMVKPKMVYISNATEMGSIYMKEELEDISRICREKNLILFLDGARLGTALTCKKNDLDISDIAELTDVFYIGGTKNGALLGEALVILKDELKEDFRYLIKQKGALMAKGFVLGIQFEALFQDDLYFQLASHANNMSSRLAEIIENKGYKFLEEPCSNLLFPIFPNLLLEKLGNNFIYELYEKVDGENTAIRMVTSWATDADSIDAFKKALD